MQSHKVIMIDCYPDIFQDFQTFKNREFHNQIVDMAFIM